jgi:hypothetical protein
VEIARGSTVADLKSMDEGIFWTTRALHLVYSWKPPSEGSFVTREKACLISLASHPRDVENNGTYPRTRSPFFTCVTPSPTSWTSPATSVPRTLGYFWRKMPRLVSFRNDQLNAYSGVYHSLGSSLVDVSCC